MNNSIDRNIRRLASLSVISLLIVALALGYWQFFRAPDLTARAQNPRLLEADLKVHRGRILDRNGKVLVDSVVGDDGYVQRRYLMPSLAPVVGYFSAKYGSTGIEEAYDDYLSGRAGLTPERLLDQYLFRRPSQGSDVVLTIDSQIQEAAERAFGDTDRGAVVVLDPETGEVLAMVSKPTFDPNDLSFNPNAPRWSVEQERIDANWKQIIESPGSPLVNRAIQSQYAPGSTFKTITLAAALELGVVNPETRYHFDLRPADATHSAPWHENEYTVDMNHSVEDFDLAGAYAWSCNVVFSELGVKIGPDNYVNIAKRFGLEAAPPFDLPVVESKLFNSPAFFRGQNRDFAVAQTAFGQGQLSVTPLEMALVAAAPANNGTIPSPYLVSEVRDPSGQIVYRRTPSTWQVAMPANIARQVHDMMVTSAKTGWAQTGEVEGLEVGGKTGTAETLPGQKTHAWYIGFAPDQEPKVAVAVIKEFAGGGSLQAGPVAKAVFEAAGG